MGVSTGGQREMSIGIFPRRLCQVFASAEQFNNGEREIGEASWIRLTLCFRKIGGVWKVTHEHTSVPFTMDGSLKAAVDLTP